MDVTGIVFLAITSVGLALVLSGVWLMMGNLMVRRWIRDERPLECQAEPANWRRLVQEGRLG